MGRGGDKWSSGQHARLLSNDQSSNPTLLFKNCFKWTKRNKKRLWNVSKLFHTCPFDLPQRFYRTGTRDVIKFSKYANYVANRYLPTLNRTTLTAILVNEIWSYIYTCDHVNCVLIFISMRNLKAGPFASLS